MPRPPQIPMSGPMPMGLPPQMTMAGPGMRPQKPGPHMMPPMPPVPPGPVPPGQMMPPGPMPPGRSLNQPFDG